MKTFQSNSMYVSITCISLNYMYNHVSTTLPIIVNCSISSSSMSCITVYTRYTSCDERTTFQLQYNSMYVQLCVYHICVNYICIPICLVHVIQSELKKATWIMFMYTCEEIKTLHQPPNPKFQKPFTLNIFFYFTIA